MTRFADNIGPTMIEVLQSLRYSRYIAVVPREWVRPLDIGATNGSHHSGTLNRLAERGLVRYKQRGAAEPPPGENGGKIWRGRGAKCYQITPAGLAVLEERGQ